jgi:hypothetical protein
MRVFNINFNNDTSSSKKSFWIRALIVFISTLICLLLFNKSVKIDSIPIAIIFAVIIALCNSCCKFILKISSILASILITFIIAIFADNVKDVELRSFMSTWGFTIGVYIISFLINTAIKIKQVKKTFSQPMKEENDSNEVEEGFTSYEEVIEEDNDEEFNKNNNL